MSSSRPAPAAGSAAGARGGGFLPFLPLDNDAAFDSELAGPAVAANAAALQALLAQAGDARAFASGVARAGDSLHTFVRTYLQHRRRFYDVAAGDATAASAAAAAGDLRALDAAVLALLTRLSTTPAPQTAADGAAGGAGGGGAGAGAGGRDKGASAPAPMLSSLVLDPPSLLDLCSLFGPSNATTVADLLRRTLEPAGSPVASGTASALQQVADVLVRDVPRGLASAQSAEAVEDVATYLCDALHGTSKLLALSPWACYALMPGGTTPAKRGAGAGAGAPSPPSPAGVHAGAGLLQPPSSLVAALIATYEYTLPAVLARLIALSGPPAAPSSATPTSPQSTSSSTSSSPPSPFPLALPARQVRRMQVACHAALQAVFSVLDTCYVEVLRGGKSHALASGPTYRAVPGRSDGRQVGPALCTTLAALADAQPDDPLAAHPSLAAAVTGARREGGAEGTFFRDLCRTFRLRDTLQPVLGTAAASGYLDDAQRSYIGRLVTEAEQGGRISPRGATGSQQQGPSSSSSSSASSSSATTDPAAVASVREILPDTPVHAVEAALHAARGNVEAAIERLLSGVVDPAPPPRPAASAPALARFVPPSQRPAIDADLRSRTLALARAQSREAEAAEAAMRAVAEAGVPLGSNQAALVAKQAAAAVLACDPGLDNDGVGELGEGRGGRRAGQWGGAGADLDGEGGEDAEAPVVRPLGRSGGGARFSGRDDDDGVENYDDEYDDIDDEVEHVGARDGGTLEAEAQTNGGGRGGPAGRGRRGAARGGAGQAGRRGGDDEDEDDDEDGGEGEEDEEAGGSDDETAGETAVGTDDTATAAAVSAGGRGASNAGASQPPRRVGKGNRGPVHGLAPLEPRAPRGSAAAAAAAAANPLLSRLESAYKGASTSLDDGIANYHGASAPRGPRGGGGDGEEDGEDDEGGARFGGGRGGQRGGGRARGRGRGRGGASSAGGAAGAPVAAPAPVEGHGPRARGGVTEGQADFRRENKARFGNHNRKRGADKKRGRGM
jgi:hypothetical protein